MLDKEGAVQTVVKLVSRARPSEGFVKLWELKRLDLTVEAVIQDPQWAPLLAPDIVNVARRRLIESGFSIQPPAPAPQQEVLPADPLRQALLRILSLQLEYAAENTPAMQERGVLIRSTVPNLIKNGLSTSSWSVEGKDGIGRKAESAWVRIYDRDLSPSATVGWYVVLHFALDGKSLFLNIGCGATYFRNGSISGIDDDILEKEVRWVRALLQAEPEINRYRDEVRLGGNRLSEQFEKAIAFSRRYPAQILRSTELLDDLKQMLGYLQKIYAAQQLGKGVLTDDVLVREAKNLIEAVAGRTSSKSGQGRGLTAAERKAVEMRAMTVARTELSRRHFSNIEDHSASNPYDFRATSGGADFYIEVKGTTSSTGESILLTRGERDFHHEHSGQTILVVVYDIDLVRGDAAVATGGTVLFFAPWDFSQWSFEPTAYEVRMPKIK
jgi:hypothetical protein